MALARKKSRSSGSSVSNTRRFVLCAGNQEYPASLEVRKLYPVIPDAGAEKHDLVRIIDESGEDYLYPAEYFVALPLPQNVKRAIAVISQVDREISEWLRCAYFVANLNEVPQRLKPARINAR